MWREIGPVLLPWVRCCSMFVVFSSLCVVAVNMRALTTEKIFLHHWIVLLYGLCLTSYCGCVDLSGVIDFEAWTPRYASFYSPGRLGVFPAHKGMPVVLNISNITLAADFYTRDELVIALPGMLYKNYSTELAKNRLC